jgi:sugar phosphate permease
MANVQYGAPVIKSKQEKALFWRGVFIWGLATLFYFNDNLLNVSPGAMATQLIDVFNISRSELGILSSCFLWSYGIMQIPAGLLMDSVGPRKVLTFASLSCVVGTMLFAIADTIQIACIGRILIGFGAAFAVVGCSKIAANWFAPRRFASFMGMMVAIGYLGGAFGLAGINLVVDVIGWQETLFLLAVVALVLAVLIWLFIRDQPPVHLDYIPESAPSEKVSVLTGLKEVVFCGQDWLASIYAGLMYVPTIAFGALWGAPYLIEAHGFAKSTAGILSSLVFVGWVFGGPVYGWVSDYIGRRNLPMYVANIATLIVSLWIIYGTNHSVVTVAIGMFLLGFFSCGFLLAFVVTREKNRPEIAGTAIGFVNTINTFSGAALQILIGWVLDMVATDVIITESGKAFTLADYQKALMSIPICLVVALIALSRVKETYCIVKHED